MVNRRIALAAFLLSAQPLLSGLDDIGADLPPPAVWADAVTGDHSRSEPESDGEEIALEPDPSSPPERKELFRPGGFGGRRYVNGIVATANGRLITAGELRQELLPAMVQIERQATSQSDFERRVQEAVRQIVGRLVDRALIVQEFERTGMKIPEAQKNFQLDEFIRDNFDGDRVKFVEKLRERGKTLGQFKKEMEEGFIVDWMRHRIRRSRSEISPLQLSEYYRDHQEEFCVPAAVRIGQIFLPDGQGDMGEVLERLKSGEDFATVRDRFYPGGARMEEEWVPSEDLLPELCAALEDLPVGDYAGPIPVPGGSLIVTPLARRGGSCPTVEEVQDEIEGRLCTLRISEAYERWLAKLRRQAYIQTYL
ncbi:MAG: SurA N-terminal domain-containing protein [Puniceicoccales bacterium]|jgi:peptidyl-prolyl cis-trans isomerase SurA|nr:SurA N-terminal domain-containing protein [Puniceicoccales bacterium]